MNCLNCGYDLRELTEPRCPECGRGFDPLDPKSWGAPKAFRFRTAAVIAGWVSAGIATLIALAAGLGMLRGQTDLVAVIYFWMFGAIPVLIGLFIWVACLSASRRGPSRRAIFAVILLFVLNASLLTEWPIHVGFALHRKALNRQVQQAHAGNAPAGPTQIGIYHAYSVGVKTMPGRPDAVFIKIGQGNGPDYFVYGMTDSEIQSSFFNVWSSRRLDRDWHIVHED